MMGNTGQGVTHRDPERWAVVKRWKRRPILPIIAWVALVTCYVGCHSARTAQPNRSVRYYPLHGEIVRLEPEVRHAVIRQEKIKGWMGAQIMDFPVRNEQEYNRLARGDRIIATIFVDGQGYWIGEIKILPAAKASLNEAGTTR